MAEQLQLTVAPRESTGKNESRRLRREGRIPAVLYGEKKDVLEIAVEARAVEKILHSEKGMNAVVDLALEGTDKTRAVMIREVQVHPVTDALLHCDFIRIVADHAVTIHVAVDLRGVPKGVKDQGGMLDQTLREIEVRCLPRDIPSAIRVDVSRLELDDVLHVRDLELPPGAEVLTDPDRTVCTIHAPKMEKEIADEEEAAAEAAAAAATEGEEPKPEGDEEEEKPAE